MNLDRELEINREYWRILDELSPDDRLRFLGKDFNLQRQLYRKDDYRRALAKLSATEKLQLLEELRRRAQIQKGDRRSELPSPPPPLPNGDGMDGSATDLKPVPKTSKRHSKAASRRFGGRATASGVNYEVRIAAFIAVKMLAGNQCAVWSGISGADVSAITMQAPEPVDDVVIELSRDPEAHVFISAKKRSNSITLSKKNPTFVDTVDAFIRQFLKITPLARQVSRLVWAVPSSAGRSVSYDLAAALDAHRNDAGDDLFTEFLARRAAYEMKAIKTFVSVLIQKWKGITGQLPTANEMRSFLRCLYVETYDFGSNGRQEREAEENIRSHIVAQADQVTAAWQGIERFFANANQHGIRTTSASLRKALVADGLKLKSPPDYAEEIVRLRQLTDINLSRLEEHTALRFGLDTVHVPRAGELSALLNAVKSGHLLIAGEPGCGKSGIIHQLVKSLEKEGCPVILLLADEVVGRDWKASANLPDFAHALDEILANWQNGETGFLVTDALDAVRDAEAQKRLRRLLNDVQRGRSGWRVVASVREYDLQYGRELRDAFPGAGVEGHSSKDFAGVAHFYLTRFSESQLNDLVAQREEIRPFVESARKNAKSGDVHRSPFYLRLATELLRDGTQPQRLADWNSPAVLFRKFWDARVVNGLGANERQVALEKICRQMVNTRAMTLSLKTLSLGAPERRAIDDLRGRGILQAPALLHGTQVGSDEIRFTHHLLHDYGVARSLIPETPPTFCDFAIRESLLPVFYRQSFLFALEELWDVPDDRKGFWEAALQLEGVANLHSLARILAPILAARRVFSISDLQPLLTAIKSSKGINSAAIKALQHLASGLQDADANIICAGALAWCKFSEQLGLLLPTDESVELPLVHILARLNSINDAATEPSHKLALNAAGRSLLALHVSKTVSKYRRYFVHVTIETLCRTFTVEPTETKRALLSLLAPERLAQFPHDDLFELSNSIKYLGSSADSLVLQLFTASFISPEPPPDQYEDSGSAILSLRFQSRDQWNLVQYSLSEYYARRTGENPAFMTAAACIAWNSIERLTEERILARTQFRGVNCEIVEDYFHISGRGHEQNENRILSHFENLLREWAAAGDITKLNAALDAFAVSNHTSIMWNTFLETGSRFPSTLGVLLECVLDEPTFLIHPDYSYGGTALLGALHKFGDAARRERLERRILDLPNSFRLHEDENRNPLPSRIEYAQNRLLNVLEEQNIVLEPLMDLRRARLAVKALPPNERPTGPQVIAHAITDEERVASMGADLKQLENREMYHLREALKPFTDLQNKKPIDMKEVERNWPVIEQCERALKEYGSRQPAMAKELWGHLVGACEKIASYVTLWPKADKRWYIIRQILLKASTDPLPVAYGEEDTRDGSWPSWGWPAPRIDAARGLPFLVLRIGRMDEEVADALRQLCCDQSLAVRFNLAERLAPLVQESPKLMWELIDAFVTNERKLPVLDMLLYSLDRLWGIAPDDVKPRVRKIADCIMRNGPSNGHVYETLANVHLFHYLRTGDADCLTFVSNLIEECDSERASHALGSLLQACRAGGWLAVGDGIKRDEMTDRVRSRTWGFFAKLLTTAQAKLREHRTDWDQICKSAEADAESLKRAQEKVKRSIHLVDGVAMQLFFACGAFDDKNKDKVALTTAQLCRFWQESHPLFSALAAEPHPHTAHQMVQTLHHLLPCAPKDIFLLAAKTISNSAREARFQYESLAVGDVVKLIQHVLADHRDIFQAAAGRESECLVALLEVLDLFVEAGWPEARQLTHRLEEIYR